MVAKIYYELHFISSDLSATMFAKSEKIYNLSAFFNQIKLKIPIRPLENWSFKNAM